MAARCGVNPIETVPIMMIKGNNMYPYRNNWSRIDGNFSFGKPRMPNFFASKWVPMKMPEKYKIAGMTAAAMIVAYDTPKYSIMMNAAAPMTGGMICPPVEADAS